MAKNVISFPSLRSFSSGLVALVIAGLITTSMANATPPEPTGPDELEMGAHPLPILMASAQEGVKDEPPTESAQARPQPVPTPTAHPYVKVPTVPKITTAIDSLPNWKDNAENTCDPHAKPGVVRFQKLLTDTYGKKWSNIVRDCPSPDRGSSGHHAGRAMDWSLKFDNPKDLAEAETLVSWLLAPDAQGNKYAMARRLGLFYVIWNDQVFKMYRTSNGWTEYNSCYSAERQDPRYVTFCHRDHIHFSFTWAGANAETSFYVADGTAKPTPTPSPTPTVTEKPKPAPEHECVSEIADTPAIRPRTDLSFVAIDPVRVLDTRSTIGVSTACTAAARTTFDLDVTKNTPIAAGKAAAVVLNLTATEADGDTWVSAYPNGGSWPGTSSVNVIKGGTSAALVTVPVGANDAVTIRTGVANTKLVVDLLGYFTADGSGHKYTPMVPTRTYNKMTAANQWKTIRVPIPETATAILGNVAGDHPEADSFLSIQPQAGGQPKISSLNPPPGRAVGNRVIVGATDQSVSLYVNQPQRAVLDVNGWFGPQGTTTYTPVQPSRLLDTREAAHESLRASSTAEKTVQLGGKAGIPADAAAAVVTVTAVNAKAPTYLSLWSNGTSWPGTSDLNLIEAAPQANMAVVRLDKTGKAQVKVGSGDVDYIIDVLGYYRTTP